MGAGLSSTTGGAAAATKKQQGKKRKEAASPMRLNRDQEANEIKFDDEGRPWFCLYEKRYDQDAAYFKLRKGSAKTSDFTDVARANLMREYAVAKAGSAESCESILLHYTTTPSAIQRWQKKLTEKASTDGDKTNSALSASFEIKEDSLPKMKPSPDTENRHPNKLNSTPRKLPTKKKQTPKRTTTKAPRLTPRLTTSKNNTNK